jgi:hypothetical protein
MPLLKFVGNFFKPKKENKIAQVTKDRTSTTSIRINQMTLEYDKNEFKIRIHGLENEAKKAFIANRRLEKRRQKAITQTYIAARKVLKEKQNSKIEIDFTKEQKEYNYHHTHNPHWQKRALKIAMEKRATFVAYGFLNHLPYDKIEDQARWKRGIDGTIPPKWERVRDLIWQYSFTIRADLTAKYFDIDLARADLLKTVKDWADYKEFKFQKEIPHLQNTKENTGNVAA